MNVTLVIGTRPQLIKVAALLPTLTDPLQVQLIDTAQHHDENLAGRIYRELGIRSPDVMLNPPGILYGEDRLQSMRSSIRRSIAQYGSEVVVVFGDTDSTLAGALAADDLGIPIVHVEAGVRSGDLNMPEERNRIAVDKLSALRLCTSPSAVTNLEEEVSEGTNLVVGDLMADLLARLGPQARQQESLDLTLRQLNKEYGSGEFLFATLHRADTREPSRLKAALATLEAGSHATGLPLLFAAHPGTSAALRLHAIKLPECVCEIPPVGYVEALTLSAHAAAVMTDSGGLQREAVWLNTPTLILRDTTEWPELLHPEGSSLLVGVAPSRVADALKSLGFGSGAAAVAARAVRPLPTGGAAAAIRVALLARHFAR